MQKYVSCFSLFGGSVTNAPVVGNGIALGLTNGTLTGGLQTMKYKSNVTRAGEILLGYANVGKQVGSSGRDEGNDPEFSSYTVVGVTSDSTKSGLIAKFSGLTLGTIPSEKLGSFYIRYQCSAW